MLMQMGNALITLPIMSKQIKALLQDIPTKSKPPKAPAHIIVVGNEKGGSGKSTVAMHIAIALLRMGYQVGSIDLDAHQGTFSRYLKNRFDYIARARKTIPSPQHMALHQSRADKTETQHDEDQNFLEMALWELDKANDFIIIDTQGSHNFLGSYAHSFADTLITPMNDSLIDFDLIAHVDPNTMQIIEPSSYTKMVHEQSLTKFKRDGSNMRWIIMRNRLSHLDAKNKRDVQRVLDQAAKDFGFEAMNGFGERVIFKELFLRGLTLMDLSEEEADKLTMSQLSARQEVRQLMQTINPQDCIARQNMQSSGSI